MLRYDRERCSAPAPVEEIELYAHRDRARRVRRRVTLRVIRYGARAMHGAIGMKQRRAEAARGLLLPR